MRLAKGLAVLLALVPGRAFAASASDGATVLRLPLSARAAALGGALTAVDGGLDSLGINPAGAAAARRPEFLTSFFTGIADDSFGFFGYAHPLKAGTAFAGFSYYDAGTVGIVNLDGSQQTVVAERDYIGTAGWAMPLGGGVSVGALGKAYKFTLAQSASASGFAGDAGARWATPLRGLSLGAAVQNVGPNVKFEQTGDPLPLTARAGAAWTYETRPAAEDRSVYSGTSLTLTADAIQVRNESTTAAAGAECSIALGQETAVTVRLGNQFNSASDGGLAFGVGLREGRFTGDYALASRGAMGNVQTFSLGARF
jgi:hypothetical protein